MKKFVVRIVAFTTIGLVALSAIDANALALTGVKSRKVHSAAGPFDLPIDTTQSLTASVTVEPRALGAGHVIVFQFDDIITTPGIASAVDPFGPFGTVSMPVITGAANNEVSVTLTGIPDNKRVTISLTQVNGIIGGLGDFAVSMGFLVGDVDSTRVVSPVDISRIKLRSGQPTTGASFVYDLNATGAINSTDISTAKARSGLALVSASEVSLFVTKPGTGLGTITSTPVGINCGSTCAANFPQNASITVTAAPSTGSTFTGWSGACTGAASTSMFTLAANATCNANFTVNTYAVTPSAVGIGGGTISPATVQTINHGQPAIFTVTPNGGFSASVGGTCGGSLVGTTYTTAPVIATCTVVATFIQIATYPWPVWDPNIPTVPPSTTGKTYYVDGTNGSNTNNGMALNTAYKTIAKALSVLAAGDTVLIRAGLYREPVDLSSSGVSGTAAKPITIGSYGDGEVIIDGSQKVTWTQVSGTIWKSTLTFTPVGVVVNEVPLKQVRQGQGGSTAPQEGLAGVTSGSGKWHFASATNVLTADMQTTIGTVNPNTADIVVPNNVGNQQHVFFYDQNYIKFKGLTVRGSGSNGIWGYGANITVDSCNIKFNGKAAVSYLALGAPKSASDNAVITSHVYHNNLVNWPRGTNGFAETGGGWPGTVVWDSNLRPLARGNIVHMNGGEGIISYGTQAGITTGSALFEQNVAYDNWSVNMYFDNQPNNVARNNFLFNHPPDTSTFLYVGAYPYDSLDKFTVCLMLADEANSSDATNGNANLNFTSVYNNIIAGCRIGIRDYSEGDTTAVKNHGLKNAIIVNNTIIMPFNTYANASTYGIYLQDNTTPSGTNRNVNTKIQNNLIYGFHNDPLVFSEVAGALGGISLNNNTYFSSGATPFGAGYNTVTFYNFAGWKTKIAGSDLNSIFQDPLLVDVTQFRAVGISPYLHGNADLSLTSPARGIGTPQTFLPSVDFRLTPRSGWNIGAF